MTIDAIVIHHADAPRATTVADIRKWHMAQGWRDIGYHYLIRHPLDGSASLHIGRRHDLNDKWEPWEYGAHTKGHNSRTMGLCLIGQHSRYAPTPESLDVLHGWLVALCLRFGLTADDVRGHREMSGTATECPGKSTDMDAIRERLRAALDSRAIEAV